MTPYWQSADGAIVVYCAPFEAVLAGGGVPVADIALVHDDPPYGNHRDVHRPGAVERRARKNTRGTARRGAENGRARRYPPIPGNDRPHDPAPLLALGRPLVTWGADHYASRLPDVSTDERVSWIVWDKRDGTVPDDSADTELAWSNLGGARRTFRHAWRGLARASETGTPHLGPTQKPIALCAWIYQRAKLKPGALVFVPHGGSGPDLPACRAIGLRLIWCDVEAWCCDTAVARLPDAPIEIVERVKQRMRAVEPARIAVPAGPLFDLGSLR